MATKQVIHDGHTTRQTTLDDLPDSLLEQILIEAAIGVRKAQNRDARGCKAEVQQTVFLSFLHVNRRFRRIVFNGCLWSAEDLSSIFRHKSCLDKDAWPTFLSRLDLTKVNFTHSNFTFPLRSIHAYSEKDVCSLFDIFGHHIICLCVSDDSPSPHKEIIAISDHKKIEEILRRCRSLEYLDIDMHRETFDYATLIKPLPLKHLSFGIEEVSDVQELLKTIALTWPGLNTLNLRRYYRERPSFANDYMAPVSVTQLLCLSALNVLELKGFPLSDVGEVFSIKTLTTLHLERCFIDMSTPEIPPNSVLRDMTLRFCRVVSSVNIKNFPSLEKLDLQFEDKTYGTTCVAQCPALKSLRIDSEDSKDWHIRIKDCSALQRLQLINSPHKVIGIGRCPELHSLEFETYGRLARFSALQDFLSWNSWMSCLKRLTLDIPMYDASTKCPLYLAFPELTELTLRGDVFPSIVTVDCMKLHTLNILCSTHPQYGRLNKIRTLNLSGCTVLERLDIGPTCIERVPPAWVFDLLTRNPKLRSVPNVDKLRLITQQGPGVDEEMVGLLNAYASIDRFAIGTVCGWWGRVLD